MTLEYMKPMELFDNRQCVKICAPMVRYSKLAFRSLVREYGCDLAFTPMIVSESFINSIKARDSDFTTNAQDRPLIVQFAAKNAKELADASEIVLPYADGVDLNCGCPQRWAMQEGYGACLIYKPELVADMVAQARARVNDTEFCVSVKIRIEDDLSRTISLCQQAEKAGVSFLTVHGRTPAQRAQPVNIEAITNIRQSVSIPVVANGDINSLESAEYIQRETGVAGVMSARGILSNPAMYAGYKYTPPECVRTWLRTALTYGTPFSIFHHHLIEMDSAMPKAEKRIFNCLQSTSAVIDFLGSYYDL